jgi:hypothetical protein
MAAVVEAPPFRQVRIGKIHLRATIQRIFDWGEAMLSRAAVVRRSRNYETP